MKDIQPKFRVLCEITLRIATLITQQLPSEKTRMGMSTIEQKFVGKSKKCDENIKSDNYS